MKKDNKKLLNEINRLNELMGLNKKFLNEQAWIDDLITGIISAGAKQGDDIITLAAKLSDDTLTTLEKTKTLEDIIQIARKKGNVRLLTAINTQLVKSGGEMMTKLDDVILKNQSLIKSGIDSGVSKSDVIDELIKKINPNSGDEILDELIKRQLKNKIGKEYDKLISAADDVTSTTTRVTKDTETGTKKSPDDATDTSTKKSPDDATETGSKKLPDEETEKILNDLENNPWGDVESISEDVAEHILNNSNKGTFGRWVKGDFRSSAEILKEKSENIIKLSKLYTETTNTALKAKIEVRLKEDLYDLAINSKDLMRQTDSKLKEVINSFEKDVRGNIVNPKEKRFADYIGDLKSESDGFKIEKILNMTSEGKETISVLGDAFRASWKWSKLFTTIRNIGKSVKEIPAKIMGKEIDKATKETMEKIGNDRESTLNWLRSGSPRGNPWKTKYRKNYLEIIESGGLSAAKKSYILELVFRMIQWKIVFAIVYAIRNALISGFTGSEKKERLKNCINLRKSSDATQEQINSACSEYNDLFSQWAMDALEGNLDENDKNGIRFIKDLADQIFSKSTQDGETDWLGVADEITDFIPSKYDDIAWFVWRTVVFLSNDKQQEELQNSLMDGEQRAQTEIEDLTQEIDNALEEEGLDVTQTGNNSTPESSGEPGSLQHANERFGGGVTQEGEFFIWRGNKYEWDGSDYKWYNK